MVDFFVFIVKNLFDFIFFFLAITYLEKYYFNTKFGKQKILIVFMMILLLRVYEQLKVFIINLWHVTDNSTNII